MKPYDVDYYGDWKMHFFQASQAGHPLHQDMVNVILDSDLERGKLVATQFMEKGLLAAVPHIPDPSPQFITLALGFLTTNRASLSLPATKFVWAQDPVMGLLFTAMILEDKGFLDENVVRVVCLGTDEIQKLIQAKSTP